MIEYEEIGFLNHKIYKIKIDGIDNQKVTDEVTIEREYWVTDKRYNDPKENKPGIQIDGQVLCGDETKNLFSKCYNKVKDTFTQIENKKLISGYQRTWFYISVPKLSHGDYHNHLRFHPDFDEITDWTWVYYVQIPNNCREGEGKLYFRDKKDRRILHSFFPEYGYIYIFDGVLEHLPAFSPNSTIDRITAAGNVILNFED